jgi:hypothetical protein
MLVLYVLLLGALALFTAYTRNFQRTVVGLGAQLDGALGPALAPPAQLLRTMALLLAWPAAVGLGMLFFAWWKAVALVVGAFLLLVPTLGALTPRAMSAHYVLAIRADLERRLARAGPDSARLRQILQQLDASGEPPAA